MKKTVMQKIKELKGGDWKIAKQLFIGKDFSLLPVSEQIKATKILEKFGDKAQSFFLDQVLPIILGIPIKLFNQIDLYRAVLEDPEKERVKNFQMTMLLDPTGRLNRDLCSFAKWVMKKKGRIAVALMPTIGNDKRLRCAVQIASEILRLDCFDRFILSGQTLGINESRLISSIKELQTHLERNGTDRVDEIMARVGLINVSSSLFWKEGKLLDELGFGISGGAAKSQNLWSSIYQIGERIAPEYDDVLFYFTDDDYGDMNIAWDAAFHFLAGAMRLVESTDELDQLLHEFNHIQTLKDTKLLQRQAFYAWDIMHSCICARTGGVRQQVSPEFVQMIESGDAMRRNFPETLEAALIDYLESQDFDSTLYLGIKDNSHDLIALLNHCASNGIQISPQLLDKEKDSLISYLVNSQITTREMAEFAVNAFRVVYAESFRRTGHGGRVSDRWKLLVNYVWGEELDLHKLSYPLMGNFSIFLKDLRPSMMGQGYTVETIVNFVASLLGGIVTYNDGHHTHMPNEHKVIMGEAGMLHHILCAIIHKGFECLGTQAFSSPIAKLFTVTGQEIMVKMPHMSDNGLNQTMCQFSLSSLREPYLSDYAEVSQQKLTEAEWKGLLDLQAITRESEHILFFFNRMNHFGPIKLWLHPGITPVIATTSTWAEVKARLKKNQEKCILPAIVENGSAIIFPRLFLQANEGLEETISRFASQRGIEVKKINQTGLALELTERVTGKGVQETFLRIERNLRKLDLKSYGKIELQPFIMMNDAKLKKHTPLKKKADIKNAKQRWYAPQPFWIEIPSGSDVTVQEVVARLIKLCRGQYEIIRGTRFRYLVPKKVSEGTAALMLKDIMKQYWGIKKFQVKLIGIGQCSQKGSLFNKADFNIHAQNPDGKLVTETILNSTFLSVRFQDAVSIISRWLFKSLAERSRD